MQTFKNRAKEIGRTLFPYLLIILVVFLLKTFVFQIVVVRGESMSPTYTDGDILFLDKITPQFTGYKLGDIVVADAENAIDHTEKVIIKRIIGLPGDTVQISGGKVYINGKLLDDYISTPIDFPGIAAEPIELHEEEYFLLGDNRNNSLDSRSPFFGVIDADILVGRIAFPQK